MVIATLLLLSLFTNGALGDGTAPNGKPFITINDQMFELQGDIVTIQEQVDILVADVATVEESLIECQSAIEELKTKNAELQALLDQQGEYDETLATRISDNLKMIDLINSNIGDLEDEIDTKWKLENGICPDTGAIGEIKPDGSVICRTINPPSNVNVYRVWQKFDVNGRSSKSSRCYCEPGDIPVSTGYTIYEKYIIVKSSHISDKNGTLNGYIDVYNPTWTKRKVMNLIVCMEGVDRTDDNP